MAGRKPKWPKKAEVTRVVGATAKPDSPDEIGVLVDEADQVIGTATRHEIRTRNLLHRGVAVVVRNDAGEIYVHRRTPTKDLFPDMYDMVVGGMVTEGESYDEAARRELAEELGIDPADPVFVLPHRYRGERNNAWMAIYEVVWPGPIRHQEEEISWGTFMSEEEVGARLREWAFAPDHLQAFQRYLAWRREDRSG